MEKVQVLARSRSDFAGGVDELTFRGTGTLEKTDYGYRLRYTAQNELDGSAVASEVRLETQQRRAVVITESKDGGYGLMLDPQRQTVTQIAGGYGGALKQLSIGCASSAGKAYIHSGGKVKDQAVLWENICPQDTFLEAMADAASTVADHFAGKIAYVAVMKNLSVDCDCCAVAENPCMGDIGILASLDPIAVDQACLDLVYASDDPGRDHLVERIESLNGVHTVEAAAEFGFGSREYELIEL